MPEIKHLFNAGRMNKDLDERLVPNGEYRDALNVQLATSDGSNVGAIQNMRGNELIGSTISGETVGSIVDDETNKIYWFVKNDGANIIAEYNQTTEVVSPVLVDLNGVLNFPLKITAINIFEGLLAWTDNVDEPKIINIEDLKAGSTNFTSHTQLYGRDFIEKDITVIKNKPLNAPSLLLFPVSEETEQKDKMHELEFVRFAYRWKFKNGQLSVFSPFSETAFLPGNFKYDAENAYNEGMVNQLSSLSLNNFEYDINEVEAIDILIKKSNDQNVYKVERVKVSDFPADGIININSEQLFSVLPSDQLLRQWDAVPLKAKAQEYLSGRLVYGNYTIGEDTSDIVPDFSISTVNRPGSNYRRSIKSNRTYQFGVLFEDKYGRQTPVISNKTGSINIPFNNKDYLNNILSFQVEMQDTLPANNFDRFKFYIKEASTEYYNISVISVFPDPTEMDGTEAVGDVWAALPSTEINKFEEGDFISLKKRINEQMPFASITGFDATKAKFRVSHVQSNAPDFIGTAPATTPTNTNFPYETFDTEGKFFIKLADVDDMLKSMYTVNPNPLVGYEITGTTDLPPWYTVGTNWVYLGNRTQCEQDPYTSQWKKRTFNYYFDPNSEQGILYVKDMGTVVDQNCTSYTGVQNQEGSLVTADVTTDCGETIPANERWYGPFTSPEIPPTPSRLIYAQWNISQNGGVDKIYVCPEEAILNLDTPAIFETEVTNSPLDLYYETEESYPISEYNDAHTLRWFNCYNFQNGVESNRIRDDYNAVLLDKQVRVSTVLDEEYNQVENKSGFIWSGLFNSRNSINRLNQFSTANPITKDLNPEYGSIQRILARDTDLIAFCYDKVLRILANKDALFNADGSTNITASTAVLGQAMPYTGEYGISNNPESFAKYGNRIYFSDKARGAVLRLSRDGLTVISEKGMNDFFRDILQEYSGSIVGSYDIVHNTYNISFGNQTISFNEAVDGWTTRLTFVPEEGCYLNNTYYTLKNGSLWMHNSEIVNANTFYNVFHPTKVKFIFNNEPSVVKNFKTLGYEGTQSKTSSLKGWSAETIETDQQSGKVLTFKGKEGKWFNSINGISTTLTNMDTKEFSLQGIGNLSGIVTTTIPPTTTTTSPPTTTTTTLTPTTTTTTAGITTTTTAGPTTTTTAGPTTTTTTIPISTTTTSTSTTTTSTTTTTTCSPAGTLINTYCSGGDLYGTYTNGSCGTYNQLIESNSSQCATTTCTPNGTYLYAECGGASGYDLYYVYANGSCGTYSVLQEMDSASCDPYNYYYMTGCPGSNYEAQQILARTTSTYTTAQPESSSSVSIFGSCFYASTPATRQQWEAGTPELGNTTIGSPTDVGCNSCMGITTTTTTEFVPPSNNAFAVETPDGNLGHYVMLVQGYSTNDYVTTNEYPGECFIILGEAYHTPVTDYITGSCTPVTTTTTQFVPPTTQPPCTQFFSSTNGESSSSAACSIANTATRRNHNGSGAYPEIGDLVYFGAGGCIPSNLFNGGNQWYYVGTDTSSIRINSSGVVTDKAFC